MSVESFNNIEIEANSESDLYLQLLMVAAENKYLNTWPHRWKGYMKQKKCKDCVRTH